MIPLSALIQRVIRGDVFDQRLPAAFLFWGLGCELDAHTQRPAAFNLDVG
jgi:hypothetical protein